MFIMLNCKINFTLINIYIIIGDIHQLLSNYQIRKVFFLSALIRYNSRERYSSGHSVCKCAKKDEVECITIVISDRNRRYGNNSLEVPSQNQYHWPIISVNGSETTRLRLRPRITPRNRALAVSSITSPINSLSGEKDRARMSA